MQNLLAVFSSAENLDLLSVAAKELQYDRLELQQSKLLYLSSETSPEASQ